MVGGSASTARRAPSRSCPDRAADEWQRLRRAVRTAVAFDTAAQPAQHSGTPAGQPVTGPRAIPVERRSAMLPRIRLLALFALLVVPAAPLGAQEATSADARLRALYTAEWEWRQRELSPRSDGSAYADRFPRVDAASQQARLEYWTRVLNELESIPFDQLSPEERVNAQVFRASLRALVDDIRFKAY